MTAQRKRGLGRGLDALFGPTNPTQQSTPMSEMAEVAIADIFPNPLQPRHDFDDEALSELSASIANLGVIQPITLRRREDGKYTIISGERRWRASQMAGLETLPAYIREVDDEDLHAMALVENIQREDLNAIEIALGMQRLIEECGLTQEAMAEKVGKKRSTVSNYMRLLGQPSEVQLALKEGVISMGHAKAIAALEPSLQIKAMKRCVKRGLSVRQAEDLARKMTTERITESEVEEYPESYSKLVDELERLFSENISIKRTKSGSSKITIECTNDEEVDRLIDKLHKINCSTQR
ncbi:MAG: ParB/RepB/Spo0J family partition protein [Alistipes sp.]|nr:ParB/RepB/Spo0J family partition protein [Alistipes sp.]